MKKTIYILIIIMTSVGLMLPGTIYASENQNNINNNINDQYPVMDFPVLTDEDILTMDPDPQPTRSFDDLPSHFSWADYDGDWTTSAKNQGSCGFACNRRWRN